MMLAHIQALNHIAFHLLRVFSNIIQQILINYNILEKFLRKTYVFENKRYNVCILIDTIGN